MQSEEIRRIAEPAVEITGVEILDAGQTHELLWFGIDGPAALARVPGYDIVIAGWVVHPVHAVDRVEVVSDGDSIGWGRTGLRRPDLAERLPEISRAAECGFQFAIGTLTLDIDFECTVEAVLDDGRRIALARVRGRRPGLPASESPTLEPLIVSSLGRSGSTLLLCLLAGHPAIVVHRVAPYENRTSSYWLHVFHVLSSPANHGRAGDPGTFLSNPHYVGQNPFDTASPGEPLETRTWYARTQVERVANFCRGSVDSFYRTLAAANDQPAPVYFAEKRLTDVLANRLAHLYPNGREIFLVRDFRDLVASIFAFNAKRGYQAFGRQHFGSDEEYVARVGVWARQLLDGWRRRAGKSLLVRYEDLVMFPEQQLAAILTYLDLEPDRAAIEGMINYAGSVPELARQKTTVDSSDSIGRWRTDLSDRLRQACASEFDAPLREFGYSE